MIEIKEILKDLGINLPLILAGTIGGFVKTGAEKELGWQGRLTAVLSGGAIANYLTPFVVGWLDFSESSQYGFAFLLGFLGLKGVEWIILKFQNKYGEK